MKIYIASSWKNKHGVEMLTALLRERGHEVTSWIENCDKEGTADFVFEEWVGMPEAERCFLYDVRGATGADLLIYYGPGGKDACAELGAAWQAGVPVLGLWAKGEDLGLMRKMVGQWYVTYQALLAAVAAMQTANDATAAVGIFE